ncbi:MAG TPA: DUF58 domain-containing protein [Methanolinea sp.]|nr:DUF58 domain-containing protein [Methanolinea sp.]HQI14802.1 DUF58 domain-containing protein [Methanolinea sp.]
MRPSRRTVVLLIAAAVSLLLAWSLDSAPALFLAGSISGLVAVRAFLFLHAAGTVASGVRVERTATPFILRQGSPVNVTCTVHLLLPHGLRAEVSDVPPPGAPLTKGSLSAEITLAGSHGMKLAYGLSCISCGRLSFGGVDIVLHDPFFSLLLPFRGGAFSHPTLLVDPVGRFRAGEGSGIIGDKDSEARKLLRGYGIRSFRGYMPGDDPRTIDWKLTAKHGKLFVREYAGMIGKNPLLVADLPDSAMPCPASLRDAVIGSALDAVREMCRMPRGCSLMVICGPNLLSFLPNERSSARLERALREYSSPQQVLRCYRALDPAVAEAFRQRLGETEGNGDGFPRKLREIYSAFIPAMEPLPFEVQCARALARQGDTALHVLSTGWGDASHLAILGLQARRRGVDARIGIPDSAISPDLLRRLKGWGYTVVRVMA